MIVIGCDTVVYDPVTKKILEKPKDAEEAKKMVYSYLKGDRVHEVVSGVCLLRLPELCVEEDGSLKSAHPPKMMLFPERTQVYFKNFIGHAGDPFDTDETFLNKVVDAYVATGEWEGKAGGYGIQALGGMLVDKIEGDYQNVVGLPFSKLCEYLSGMVNIKGDGSE